MKKAILFCCVLCIAFCLASCAAAGGKPMLSVPVSSVSAQNGTTVNYSFSYERTMKRSDGLYEVFCRRVDEDSGEEAFIRSLYISEGMPIGERTVSESTGNQDYVGLFDTDYESYKYAGEGNIDRIEDGRIYYLNGGYEEMEVKDGRIRHVRGYTDDETQTIDVSLNEFGQTESLRLWGEDGEIIVEVRTSYQQITTP